MKKKKLFLGLAIASAALFGLAACNNTGNAGGSTSVPSVTPSTSQSTPEASSSAPAASSSAAEATEFSVVIKAKYSDKTSTDTLSTVTVANGGKINRPNDTVKEGYVFVDYFTNSALTKYLIPSTDILSWKRYKLFNLEKKPLAIWFNPSSPISLKFKLRLSSELNLP